MRVCGSHDSVSGGEEVPGASEAVGGREQKARPGNSHCCIYHCSKQTPLLCVCLFDEIVCLCVCVCV